MRSNYLALLLSGGVLLSAGPVLAIDWAGVPARDVTVFYPGQSSWEWALTPTDHQGAPKFREGKDCHDCHRGEEASLGDKVVSGKVNEPAPIAGKPGSIVAHVKVAHDEQRFYVLVFQPNCRG